MTLPQEEVMSVHCHSLSPPPLIPVVQYWAIKQNNEKIIIQGEVFHTIVEDVHILNKCFSFRLTWKA